jgi:phosphoesterase RecJ-like protein
MAEEPSPKFRFIDQRKLFRVFSSEEDLPIPAERAIFIVVDTHDFGYLGSKAEDIMGKSPRCLVIDHHEPHGPILDFQCLDPTASSTCELVFLLVSLIGASLPQDAAEAIFAGIVYDTGSFSWPKTGERTFACALELVKAGVKPYAMHKAMYESSTVGVLILEKLVLTSLELAAGNRVAIQTLTRADIKESGASYEDAEDFINTPLQSQSVEVSVFFKENLDGKLRCSLRSKGGVNVAHIAQSFGGGGHKTASGFSCDRPLAPMKEAVLETISRALDSQP